MTDTGAAAILPWDDPASTRMSVDVGLLDELVTIAGQLADAAAAPSLQHFRSHDLVVASKGVKPAAGWDPVTEADRAAETAMREVLAAQRPDDGILGEEHGHKAGTSGLTWVLDPIDGTRAYVAGLPTWCVLIAVFDGVEPIVGVIAQPFTGERWTGVATTTTRWARWSRPGHGPVALDCTIGAPDELGDAVLHTTFPEVGTTEERRAFEAARDRVRLTRYGGDAYGYALVASGTIDVVVEAGLAPYDVQALIPVVRGAGGVLTSWTGHPAHAGGRVLAARSAGLHAAVTDTLQSTTP